MSTYVIGDVQGCFDPLMKLVKAIDFNPQSDRLLFCGDLVNRGGQSLDVLRWIYAHQNSCDSVLGNHDLSLLSKYFAEKNQWKNKEFETIFSASDSSLLIDWLLNRPLYLDLKEYIIIHAGLYPKWSIKKFKKMADATTELLKREPDVFFSTMFGNQPKLWNDDLQGEDRHRFVINAATRMRFIKKNGTLNFSENRKIPQNKSLIPWFEHKSIKKIKQRIIFGHWSALGLYSDNFVTCLDTGKVWGGSLTAMRLDDFQLFSV